MRFSRFTLPGVLLGLGLGGFFDGIVLHQVLQWHHMLTSTGDHPVNTVAGLETNTLWDGFFHVATYAMTVAGLVVLMSELSGRRSGVPWSTRTFIGSMLIGWGLFNLVEGIVDHHVLGIHHVRTDTSNQLLWDLGFLGWGALMVAGGWLLQSNAPETTTQPVRRQAATTRSLG
jgi:uncharacterized membrane protein